MANRIVIDTNLWISFLISNRFSEIDQLLFTNEVTLVFSLELLEEFTQVVDRPKFKKFISSSDINKLLSIFESYADIVEVTSTLNLCRDVKDNFLINLAIDGKVDYLITGDADLLILEQIGNTKIVTWTTFVSNFK